MTTDDDLEDDPASWMSEVDRRAVDHLTDLHQLHLTAFRRD